MKKCPYCKRPLAGDICPAHGYIGPPAPPEPGIPKGIICMWSGAATAVPTSWALCDGTNGTPDLRDRFVLGAGSTYDVGDTGGATTHGHSDHAGLAHDANSLTISAHSGTAVDAHAGTAVNSHSDHTHELPFILGASSFRYAASGTGASLTPDVGVAVGASTAAAARSVSSGTMELPHTVTQPNNHTVTQPAAHSVSGSHAAQSHSAGSSIPPYYVLALIMKL